VVSKTAPSLAHRFVLDTFDRYHSREFLSPDPLEVVLTYSDPGDREIAALVCSSLALGRVNAILDVCRRILGVFPNLRRDLAELTKREISLRLGDVVYRFFGNTELTNFLAGIGRVVGWYGGLEACFAAGAPSGTTVWSAAAGFSGELTAAAEGRLSILLPRVEKGGASKRLNLFLRWMVRSDQIDPGGWTCMSPRELTVPVDTHLLRAARLLGMTTRKTADRRASEEITDWLRPLRPEDPTAFDFSLTRYGIHPVLRRQRALDSGIDDLSY
jgi:uncharacterized protein (TIGR02757 family)